MDGGDRLLRCLDWGHGRGGFAEGTTATGFYQYARGVLGGPFDLSAGLYRQYLEALMPGGSSTMTGWRNGSYLDPLSLIGADAGSEDRPPGVFGAIREHTYKSFLAFVSGRRPRAELDRFVHELNDLGLPQALDILRKEDRNLQSRRPMIR